MEKNGCLISWFLEMFTQKVDVRIFFFSFIKNTSVALKTTFFVKTAMCRKKDPY